MLLNITHLLLRYLWSHHLSEDFGVLGPGEGAVGDPARHQALVGVGPRALHLGHHGLLLFLERAKGTTGGGGRRLSDDQTALSHRITAQSGSAKHKTVMGSGTNCVVL